jgi:hypothetical protein
VRERRRRFPRLRSLTRRVSSGPHPSAVRVHHFLPGIAIALAAGATGTDLASGNPSQHDAPHRRRRAPHQ